MKLGSIVIFPNGTELFMPTRKDSYVELNKDDIAMVLGNAENPIFLDIYSPSHGRGYVHRNDAKVIK
jgi:hypothetical protein